MHKPLSAGTLPSGEPGAEFQSPPRSSLQWELTIPHYVGLPGGGRADPRWRHSALKVQSDWSVTKATAPPHPTGGHMTCLWACLVYHQGDPPATSASLAPQSLDSSCPCCPQDTVLPPTSGLLHKLFPLLIFPFPHPTSLSK